MSGPPEALRARLESAGQAHTLRFWDTLDAAAQARLVAQLEGLDIGLLARLREALVAATAAGPGGVLTPAPVVPLERPQVEIARRRERGWEAIRAGTVACLTVAGGQGTRLGYDGPKGAFEIGPVSGRPLFELFAEQLRAIGRRAGQRPLWLVMTSPGNDAQTRDLFAERRQFGLEPEQVHFFTQGTLPALDGDGKLILDRPDHVFTSPNGHGGTIEALQDSGWLRRLWKEHGVQTLFYFQVDNPLISVLDPLFLGEHLAAEAEMSTKVVRKTEAAEKVGVVAQIDGVPGVVEYSDLDPAQQAAREPDGSLRFWAGNIAVHAFNVTFLARLAAGGTLPYHRANKAIPTLDEAGQPTSIQGVKFERFIFDALPQARASVTLEVHREREFAPVKNARGVDSPESARRLMVARWAEWLESAGVPVPRGDDGGPLHPIEISPLRALDADELAANLPAELAFDGPLLLE